ncbi:RecT family recombinase [Candidatus Methylacidithermus pantelleriae]|uniref:Recombinational DNA repair protein RecT (Prophage associated) n=1 Tax=Candidatus Methylacidithermus pantelleriae TaxID=2744239 RepID=A0A8J2BPY4_9BACT|nr:RecT family recombinase [Candidatus Methylacidithermus pantelleriae]CAF0700555.1 Recombinational DNA repair protein RecT (prophage associated) [Candidatus Methylacidithermus pantelleriae]
MGTITLKDQILSPQFQEKIRRVLPEKIEVARFLQICAAAAAHEEIRGCDPITVFESILSLARWGLYPDGKYAALVAYKNVCKAHVMIAGEILLLRRSGVKGPIWAAIVYEHDTLVIEKGTNPICRWAPKLNGDRGAKIGALAYIDYGNGEFDCEYMTIEEIDQIREFSIAAKKGVGPWCGPETVVDEMRKKVVLRRLLKRQGYEQELMQLVDEMEQEPEEPVVEVDDEQNT